MKVSRFDAFFKQVSFGETDVGHIFQGDKIESTSSAKIQPKGHDLKENNFPKTLLQLTVKNTCLQPLSEGRIFLIALDDHKFIIYSENGPWA